MSPLLIRDGLMFGGFWYVISTLRQLYRKMKPLDNSAVERAVLPQTEKHSVNTRTVFAKYFVIVRAEKFARLNFIDTNADAILEERVAYCG